jgi:outer membrane lipoprotein-sorting protein
MRLLMRLAIALLLLFALAGCAVTPESLSGKVSRRMTRLQGYFAEVEALVSSPGGEQRYSVRQWFKAPAQWRSEVEFGSEQQIFIFDGVRVWIYQPGLDDYFRLDKPWVREVSPPFFLWSYLEEMVLAPSLRFEGQEKKDGRTLYVLHYSRTHIPETVRLWLDQKSLFPVLVETYRDGERLLRLTCSRLELNPRFTHDLFTFEAPADSAAAAHYLIRPLTLAEARREWPLPVYTPAYLPPGAVLLAISRGEEEGRGRLLFAFGGQQPFTLIQKPADGTLPQRTAGMQELFIGETPALALKNRLGDLYTLWWSNETSDFILSGSLPPAELLRVAASLTTK